MKFRIKHICGVGFFAQVKPSLFSKWKRLAIQSNGYSLSDNLQDGYPMPSIEEARVLIEKYKEWKHDKETRVSYYDL